MRYLKHIKTYITENKNEKILNNIRRFFKCDYVTKKAIELHPKLSTWIVKTFKNIVIKENPDISEELENYFKTGENQSKYLKLIINKWNEMSSYYQTIIDWIKSRDVSEQDRRNFTKMTFEEALKKSEEWHKSLKSDKIIENEKGNVLMTFPDGFYWIDLETTYDCDEAEAMGHCGRTNNGDTLYSLRDKNKEPHVTAAVDTENGIIYQMKGKNNTKPSKKYHKYIVELLINDNLPTKIIGFGSEYNKSMDFSPYDLDDKLYSKLISKRPNIDKPIFSDQEIDDMFERYLNDNYIEDDSYAFYLVKKMYELLGFRYVIYTLRDTDPTLFNILYEKYPNFFKTEIIDEEKIKILLKILSFHCNANHAAEYFKIKLPNPKDSNSNKWDYIVKKVPIEKLEEYIKKEDLQEYYNKEFPENEFVSYKKYYHTTVKVYDYEGILDYIFGYDDEKVMIEFEKLFCYDCEYASEVKNIWDLNSIIGYIIYNMSREQKEKELEHNSYYEYVEY